MYYWYLREQTATVTATGVQVVAVTNVACHLWLRWSTEKTGKHMDAVLRRGMVTREVPRFCVVSYNDVEQEEEGNTITHTFLVTPWPYCETRWYYLWGTMYGEATPSESPIFEYHREEPAISEVIIPCWPTGSGRLHARVSSDYECPNGAPLVNNYVGIAYYPVAGHRYVSYKHWTYRGVTIFDTTALDPGKAILSGVFRTEWYNATWPTAFNLCAVEGRFETPVVLHDYCDLYYADTIYAFIACDDMETGVEKDIAINAAGLAQINRGGWTKFGWRTSLDIAHWTNPSKEHLEAAFSDGKLKLILQLQT